MRRLVLTLFVIALLATAGVPPLAAASTCPPTHSKRLAADAEAEVYEAALKGGETAGFPFIFGCVRGNGRAYGLGEQPEFSTDGGGGIRKITRGGAFVAYEAVSTVARIDPAPNDNVWKVIVRNLRNGHTVHSVPTGSLLRPRRYSEGVGSVTMLVVRRDGAVAWIAQDNERTNGEPPTYYDIYASGRHGTRLLAHGRQIRGSYLRLVGMGVQWTEAGKRRAAVLR
jgi:hypothetical protein